MAPFIVALEVSECRIVSTSAKQFMLAILTFDSVKGSVKRKKKIEEEVVTKMLMDVVETISLVVSRLKYLLAQLKTENIGEETLIKLFEEFTQNCILNAASATLLYKAAI